MVYKLQKRVFCVTASPSRAHEAVKSTRRTYEGVCMHQQRKILVHLSADAKRHGIEAQSAMEVSIQSPQVGLALGEAAGKVGEHPSEHLRGTGHAWLNMWSQTARTLS